MKITAQIIKELIFNVEKKELQNNGERYFVNYTAACELKINDKSYKFNLETSYCEYDDDYFNAVYFSNCDDFVSDLEAYNLLDIDPDPCSRSLEEHDYITHTEFNKEYNTCYDFKELLLMQQEIRNLVKLVNESVSKIEENAEAGQEINAYF